MFEEKGPFSGSDFFEPIFNKIQAELNVRIANAGNKTDLGRNKNELKTLHEEVLNELKEYSEYCYTCQPQKKKKKK